MFSCFISSTDFLLESSFYCALCIIDNCIGILGSISPSVTLIFSPLWGALADTTGRQKELMIGTFIASTLIRSLLSFQNANVYFLAANVALSAILFAPVKPLLDSAVLSSLKDKSLYGKRYENN